MLLLFQYYSAWSNYEEAIKYLVTVPKYRIQATEIAKSDGMLKRDKKLDRGKTKEQIKEEEEKVNVCPMHNYRDWGCGGG